VADGRPAAAGGRQKPEGLGEAARAPAKSFRAEAEQGMVPEHIEGLIARDHRCASRGRLRGGLRMVRELPVEFVTQAAGKRAMSGLRMDCFQPSKLPGGRFVKPASLDPGVFLEPIQESS